MTDYFIPQIPIGSTINNDDIVKEFKCNPQGGMRRSYKTNSLVIISKHVGARGKYYDDKFIDGVYYYTGQGLEGDQSLDFLQNKTLSESESNGVGVYLFEVFKEKEYIYQGRVRLHATPIQSEQQDIVGKSRKVWVFPLALVEDKNQSTILPKKLIEDTYSKQARLAESLEASDLEQLARLAESPASSRKTYSNTYTRSPYIAAFTKSRARGNCELCEEPAPFEDKDSKPYLESHHIQWLSKGGYDSIDNTVALCPNCHKRMHVVDSLQDLERLKALRRNSV